MTLEGIVGKGYLELLKLAGYEFDFIITSKEEADKNDVCPSMDFTDDVYVRFYTSADIEEMLLPEDLIHGLEKTQLALLINNSDPEIRELVEEQARE